MFVFLKLTKKTVLISLVFFLMFVFVIWFNFIRNQSLLSDPLSQGIAKIDKANQLNSLSNNGQSEFYIAIVLDNFKDAYPISGINNAKIVYEAPVEADITRFLAIFNQDDLPDKIGPVRSVRPYLVDWAGEYGALFIHAGGSPEALAGIKQSLYTIYNLDEISRNGSYFWRDWQRKSPHNLYISQQSIINVIKDKDLTAAVKLDFKKWKVKLIEESINQFDPFKAYELHKIIKIDYREPVIWQLDQDRQIYLRYQAGQPFMDETNEQIQASNIVIQKTEIVVLDEIGRRSIRTDGSGEALIFQNGILISGRWQKDENMHRTIFYDLQGEEIEFLPGLIWVQIVSDDHKLLY